ncbi:T9SS type A sorting domain-containing protein, partial [Flavobacteriales bacterium]|nr:T9SS type A sorting domain-containing protein [Flavobacteriales bacterium]
KLRWNIGTTAATYTVPFATPAVAEGGTATKLPLEIALTGATGASGKIDFSTYETAADNNTAYPAGVLNMYSTSLGGDGSLYAVDRFWIIDATGYTAKPSATIEFTYDDDAGEIAGTNLLSEGNLQAQRYEPTPDNWGSFISGTVNTVTNKVSSVSVPVADFESVWTLADNSNPLPIELLDFNAEWQTEERTAVDLEWVTSSEINNDYFVVERSADAINYTSILQVPSAYGNSSTTIQYTDVDPEPYTKGTSYYRLKQVDFDGTSSYSNIEVLNNDNRLELIKLYPNPMENEFNYLIYSSTAKDFTVNVINNLGQTVVKKSGKLNKGVTKLSLDVHDLSAASYVFRLNTDTDVVHQEFVK